MDKFSIAVEAQSSAQDAKHIRDMLRRFNQEISGDDHYQPLSLIARSPDCTICAGLLGGTYWGWLYIETLWVRADQRSHGIGSMLLSRAEAEAAARGCSHAHVDTFEFQAPEFYRKHGYVVFGELNDLPPGHKRFFLKKDLAATPSGATAT